MFIELVCQNHSLKLVLFLNHCCIFPWVCNKNFAHPCASHCHLNINRTFLIRSCHKDSISLSPSTKLRIYVLIIPFFTDFFDVLEIICSEKLRINQLNLTFFLKHYMNKYLTISSKIFFNTSIWCLNILPSISVLINQIKFLFTIFCFIFNLFSLVCNSFDFSPSFYTFKFISSTFACVNLHCLQSRLCSISLEYLLCFLLV